MGGPKTPTTFVGDPNPPAKLNISSPVTSANPTSPVTTVAPSLPGGVSETEPLEPKGKYWVGGDDDDLTIYYEDEEGNDEEIGKVANVNARALLDKIGRLNPITKTWDIDEESAKVLKKGDLPLKDYLKAKWYSGQAGITEGLLGYSALLGEKSWKDAIAESDIQALKAMEDERPNLLWTDQSLIKALSGNAKWLVGQAAEALPSLIGGFGEGAELATKGTAALGGAALAGGVPLATVAAQPHVATAIISAGFVSGIADFTSKVTAGSTALEMKKKGFSDRSIKTVAPLVGVIAGALETVHFNLLPAPYKRAFMSKVMGNKTVQTLLTKWYVSYLKETGIETSVEVAQQAVQEFGQNFAAAIEDKPELATKKEDIAKILTDTAVRSAAAFSVLKLPGAVLESASTRLDKTHISKVKEAVKKGEIPAEEKTVDKVIVNGDKDLGSAIKKVDEVIAKGDGEKEFGVKNAENDNIKAAVAAKAESLNIIKENISEGKPLEELSEDKQKAIISVNEKLKSLDEIGKGIDETLNYEEPMLPIKEPKTPIEEYQRIHLEREGMLRQARKDQDSLMSQISDLESQIEERAKDAKPTKALENKLEKLKQLLDEKTDQIVELISPSMPLDSSSESLAKAGLEALIPAEKINRLEREMQYRYEKVQEVRHKLGERYARREAYNVQSYLHKLISRSSMNKEDKAKFLGVLKRTQTIEQLDKVYPEIRDKILAAEEKAHEAALDQMLKKTLEGAKSNLTSKRPTGKLGNPDVQSIVDNTYKILKKPKKDVLMEIPALEERLESASDIGSPDYDPVEHAKAEYAYRAAYYRAGLMTSTKDVFNFTKDLASMVNEAKSALLEKRIKEKEARAGKHAEIISEILGDIKLPEDLKYRNIEEGELRSGLAPALKAKFIGMREKFYSSLESIADLLAFNSGKKSGESVVEKFFKTGEAADREKGIKVKWADRFEDALIDSYGLGDFSPSDKAKRVRDIQKKLTIKHDLGVFETAKDENGKSSKVHLVFSRSEAIKRYMERLDPTLAENFTSPEALGYTPEIEREIFGILTDGDKKFAHAQLQLYRELYKEVNAVWRKVKGVDLPFNEFYSPIRVIGYEQKTPGEVTPDPFGERIYKNSTAGGWAKARVKHHKPLAQMSSFLAFSEHVSEIAHYIAWEEKVREWNALLVNKDFRAAVIGLYGSETLEAIQTMVERITKGRHEKVLMRGFDKWISNLVVGGIVAKPIAMVKQMTAIPAFTYGVPPEHLHLWLKEFKNIFKEGISEEWKNSPFVLARGSSMLQELKALEEARLKNHKLEDPKVIEFLAYAIKKGDKASILLGGDALFRYLRSQGKSTEEAISTVSDVARKTQSSGDISDLSVLQGNTGAWRLLTAYRNQPVQFLRIELQALRAMASKGFWSGQGRMSRTEVAKNLIIFHFIIPMFFQAVVDLGWDEEHQKRAMILGGFNDIPLLATLISNLYDRLISDSGVRYSERDLIDSWYSDIDRAIKELNESEDIDDYINAFSLFSDPIFRAAWGVPTKPFANLALAASEADDRNYVDAFKLIAGYSPYMINEQKKRE